MIYYLTFSVTVSPDDEQPGPPHLSLQRPLDVDHVVLATRLLHWQIKQLDRVATEPFPELLVEVHPQKMTGDTGHHHL